MQKIKKRSHAHGQLSTSSLWRRLKRIDRETEYYDLEKAYADVAMYFKDPKDEKLFYAIACTISPYEGYNLGDMRIFAAEKREITVTKFFEIQKS